MTNKNILLLLNDSDPLFARVCRNKFTHNTGWNAAITDTYEDAIKTIQKSKPDLVVTEIILKSPEKTGFDLITEVRAMGLNQTRLPIVVLTDLQQSSDQQKALKLGATHYFIKSQLMVNEVVEQIQNILNLPKTQIAE